MGTMFNRNVVPLLALLLMLFAQPAQAFWDPPYITPELPTAGQEVSFNIRLGVCDAFGAEPGFPQITRTGNNILYVDYGAHYEDGDELCIFPTWDYVTPIGSFQPGDYTFTLQMAYYDNFGVPTILTMGTVPFIVSRAAAPVSVPVNSIAGIFLLIVGLVIISATTLRYRRRSLLVAARPDGVRCIQHN